MKQRSFLALLIFFSVTALIAENEKLFHDKSYYNAIIQTREMVSDHNTQKLVKSKGLSLLNVTWEDTGRYKNSSLGPNISDMTIQVGFQDKNKESFEISLMPVIRYPNYSDLTTDIDPSEFTLLVGNEKGESLKRVSLYDFLNEPTAYLHDPASWKGLGEKSLLAKRDSKVLVSAQSCFLPVPKKGKAIFNPVLFNYQSVRGDPAVLTILATREGTSVTIIDNTRDAFSTGQLWGQRLFFNRNGERASLTGERVSDFVAKGGDETNKVTDEKDTAGLNMVLLIQVPLKQKNPMRYDTIVESEAMYDAMPSAGAKMSKGNGDTENAVIGSGQVEGPYTELDNLAIERDPNFPVRVTVQFYKATSTGVVTQADIDQIKKDIELVYQKGELVGSLVTGGRTGRVTEYIGSKVQPDSWWSAFWKRYEKNTGIKRTEAIKRLQNLIGKNYRKEKVSDLYLRDILKEANDK